MQFPEPYRRKNTKIYSFDYYDPNLNSRKRKSTGKYTKREAKDYILEFMQNLDKGLTDKTFREYSAPFFIQKTCPHVRIRRDANKNIGLKHINNSRSWLEAHVFTDQAFSQLKMSEIKRGDVLKLRDRIRKKGVSPSVVNKIMNAVKIVFSTAYYHEDIDRNPGSHIGALQYSKKSKGIFTVDEIKTLFHSRPGFWQSKLAYDVFLVAAQTGMRSGEILALGKSQVDSVNQILQINRAWKLKDIMGLPKWEKIRSIAITDRVFQILEPYIELKDDILFCYQNNDRLGGTWWQKNFRYAMENAEIDYQGRNLTAHCFRHTLNTNLIAAGCDPLIVQTYLGWTSKLKHLTDVQNEYTHLSAIHTDAVVRKIDHLYNGITALEIVRKEA